VGRFGGACRHLEIVSSSGRYYARSSLSGTQIRCFCKCIPQPLVLVVGSVDRIVFTEAMTRVISSVRMSTLHPGAKKNAVEGEGKKVGFMGSDGSKRSF
jgi:hypothetical protein